MNKNNVIEEKVNNMKTIFETIYSKNKWAKLKRTISVSGSGSDIINNKNFIQFLNDFIKDNHVKSVLDFGCGDCNTMSELDFSNIKYTGCDIANFPIQMAKTKFEKHEFKNNITLYQNNNIIINDTYDLLIVKHVFGHWMDIKSNGLFGLNCKSNELITYFLEKNMDKFKYIIINDHIDDRISKYFPNNFKYERIEMKKSGNRYNSIYIYNS